MTVETHYRVGSHLVDDGIGPSGERPRSYQTVLTTRSAARARTIDADEVVAFVEGTDFEESFLVVVVAGAWPSGYRLELQDVGRIQDGVRVSVAVDSPAGPVGDDAAVHSLALRITDEERRVPDAVVVEVAGEQTGSAERD